MTLEEEEEEEDEDAGKGCRAFLGRGEVGG